MNEPALKQEASGEYNISLIMPDQLMIIWEDVEKYIQPYTLKMVEYEKNKPHSLTAFL